MSADDDVEALLEHTRARLADVPGERIGVLVQPRRVLGVVRPARIEPRGSGWHLGALLLTDEALLATGQIVRARREVRRGYTAQAQRERAELAAAASRGGFFEGEAVHVDWRVLTGPEAVADASDVLVVVDGVARVRWSPHGTFMPLAAYFDERVELLRHPPHGTTG